MIIGNNVVQRAAFFSSSNIVSTTVMNITNNVSSYVNLKTQNQTLAKENALLRERLERMRQSNRFVFREDNVAYDKIDLFEFTPANVVNKSLYRFTNFLTIDKGSEQGIESGLAVIGPTGVVGKVKAVSKDYSTVTSLLHTEFLVSTKLKSTGTLSTVKWDGQQTNKAELLYLPRHVEVNTGDTVVTSGYNSLFPEGILVGIVDDSRLRENEPFHEVTISLSTDFDNLHTVYVVKHRKKTEIDSLEIQITEGEQRAKL
jgi:rod shape-determining protein MreC